VIDAKDGKSFECFDAKVKVGASSDIYLSAGQEIIVSVDNPSHQVGQVTVRVFPTPTAGEPDPFPPPDPDPAPGPDPAPDPDPAPAPDPAPDPDPCSVDPSLCAPPPEDPCQTDPSACDPPPDPTLRQKPTSQVKVR
jgi:hypothetical protein